LEEKKRKKKKKKRVTNSHRTENNCHFDSSDLLVVETSKERYGTGCRFRKSDSQTGDMRHPFEVIIHQSFVITHHLLPRVDEVCTSTGSFSFLLSLDSFLSGAVN
jgi:hypothetical protein